MTPEHILKITNLDFHYPERTLFKDWSTAIFSGVTIIKGGDGSGKTSLLKILAGELPIQGGKLSINKIEQKEQPDIYRSNVFWVNAHDDEFNNMRVDAYFSTLATTYENFNQKILFEAIKELSLTQHLEKQFFMLSTGTKRKVWLAAALSAGRPLTLLDDAFAGVDKVSIHSFVAMLNKQLIQSPQAWIISTYHEFDGDQLPTIIDLGDD